MNKMMRILWFVLLAACQQMRSTIHPSDFPGTYVRNFAHEFAQGSDTLKIQSTDELHYVILKSAGFQRIKNGKMLSPEVHREKWTGIFDAALQTVKEDKAGKILQLSKQGQLLMVGASEYQRVK